MNLTEKINPKDISDKTWSDTPTRHIYEYGVVHALNRITQKVAIDFAKWVVDNRWYSIKDNIFYQTLEFATSMSDKAYKQHHTKTTEQLFQEFLKDYNFESK